MFQCKDCKKTFVHASGMSKHKHVCKYKVNNNVENIEEDQQLHEQEKANQITNKMTEDHSKEVSELKEEIKLIKDKVAELSKVRTNHRRGMNKHVRNEVICKQNSKCNTCTKSLTEYNTNIDHKIGVQFGGTNDMDNLQALCVECHSEKTIKERRNCKKIRNAIEQILSE
jgi:5-methylcytosine-specific restriction protein A